MSSCPGALDTRLFRGVVFRVVRSNSFVHDFVVPVFCFLFLCKLNLSNKNIFCIYLTTVLWSGGQCESSYRDAVLWARNAPDHIENTLDIITSWFGWRILLPIPFTMPLYRRVTNATLGIQHGIAKPVRYCSIFPSKFAAAPSLVTVVQHCYFLKISPTLEVLGFRSKLCNFEFKFRFYCDRCTMITRSEQNHVRWCEWHRRDQASFVRW